MGARSLGLGLGLTTLAIAVGEALDTLESMALLAINTPLRKTYQCTRPYRNLRHQARLINNFVDNALPPLKSDGYQASGEDCYWIFAEDQLGAAHSGNYAFSVIGNNVPTYASSGSIAVSYSAGTNRTTGFINGVNGSQNLILGFTNSSADFGDLKLMQPGFAASDNELFTPDWVAHIERTTVMRCMDLAETNDEVAEAWADSRAAGYGKVLTRAGSIQGCMEMVAAATALGWLNTSPIGNDDYMDQYAATLAPLLPVGKRTIVELGNEPFNSGSYTGFKAYPQLLRKSIIASESFNGYSNDIANPAGRRILSMSRSGTEVTVTLDGNHGKSAGQTIYSHADTGGTFSHGTKTLIAGTTGAVLKWTEGTGTASGTIDTAGLNSYIYLNPSNSLVTPLTSVMCQVGTSTVPTPGEVKCHYQWQRLRKLWESFNALGVADRVTLCYGAQVGYHPEELTGLARALQQYGDMDWLGEGSSGLAFNCYMTPANPSAMTTADAVFTQLEAARATVKASILPASNNLRRYSLGKQPGRLLIYEWGQHIHEVPNETVGAAVQAANRDDTRMPTLLTAFATDMRDRGVGVAAFFTSGCSANFAGQAVGGSAWGLREGAMGSTPAAQVKDQWFQTHGAMSAIAQPIAGETWGSILVRDVVPFAAGSYQGGPGNALYVIAENYHVQPLYIQVTCPSTGVHTIELEACTWFNLGATLTLELDGVDVDTVALPQLNYNDFLPTVQLSFTGQVSAGVHWVGIKPSGPAPRNGQIALGHLICT